MGTLYRFELKKVLCQKIVWIAMLIMAVVLIGAGVAGNAMGKADIGRRAAQFSGREIDDSLIKEAQEAENRDDYMVFLNFITYCMGNAEHGVVDAQQVYAAREQLNEGQMTQACLSDAEKEYWREKEAEIKKPFTYYFEEGYAGIYSYIYVANFMLLLLTAVAVCGVFADEKLSGTDQIIFSSVSRDKLFAAKVLTGLSVGGMLALYLFAIVSACTFGIYGTTGFHTPLQLRIPGCMLNITIGESYLYLFMLFMLAGIIYAAFAIFLSQVLGNRFAATAIMVIGLFLSMLNLPEKLGVISKIWSYLPGAYIGSWTFTEYRLISVFGEFFNNLQAAPVVWILAATLFLGIAEVAYRHYQIKGR